MSSGLGNIDLVEILFTLFWLFFIVLVLYLHREGKREGYPLVSDRSDQVTVQGFPAMPDPKTFFLDDGRTVQKPAAEAPEEHFSAEPAANYPGAPFNPVGDPMKSGFGTGSWAKRSEVPEKTLDGKPRIIPMRADSSLEVDQRDTDPRGMTVVAGDGVDVGVELVLHAAPHLLVGDPFELRARHLPLLPSAQGAEERLRARPRADLGDVEHGVPPSTRSRACTKRRRPSAASRRWARSTRRAAGLPRSSA